jgi:glycosyltransferase involved in cell wall biosynthesis
MQGPRDEGQVIFIEMSLEVSIILPVYNAAHSVKAAVRSCLEQGYRDFELIIIDDGSTDETPVLIREMAGKDKRIKILHHPHKGIVSALNDGIAAASGIYIARMDADDVMYPERIRRQAEFLDENPQTGLVSCLVEHGGHPELQEGYARYIHWINSLTEADEISLNRFVESPLAHPSVMFRKVLIEKYGAYREGDFPEDYELWLRWMDAGVQVKKIPKQLLFWSDLSGRLSRMDERYSPEAFNRIKTDYLVRFLKEKINGRKIWLCGAGRGTRRKSDLLLNSGLIFGGYIDVDPLKEGKSFNGLEVCGVEGIPDKKEAYLVSYVGTRGARDEIRRDLLLRGFEEGNDFVMAG